MANNRLILRMVNSPWLLPTPDLTKGSVLTHAELDNNFIYLKGEDIYDGENQNGSLVLKKINGQNIIIDLEQPKPYEFYEEERCAYTREDVDEAENELNELKSELTTLNEQKTILEGLIEVKKSDCETLSKTLSDYEDEKLEIEGSILAIQESIDVLNQYSSESEAKSVIEEMDASSYDELVDLETSIEDNTKQLTDSIDFLTQLGVNCSQKKEENELRVEIRNEEQEKLLEEIKVLEDFIENNPEDVAGVYLAQQNILLKQNQYDKSVAEGIADAQVYAKFVSFCETNTIEKEKEISALEDTLETENNEFISLKGYNDTLKVVLELFTSQEAALSSTSIIELLNQNLIEFNTSLENVNLNITNTTNDITTCQSDLQILLTQLETLELQISELEVLIKDKEKTLVQIKEEFCYHVRIGDLKDEYNGTMVRINQDNDVVDFRAQEFKFYHNSNSETAGTGVFLFNGLTSEQNYTFQDKSGTIAHLDDINNDPYEFYEEERCAYTEEDLIEVQETLTILNAEIKTLKNQEGDLENNIATLEEQIAVKTAECGKDSANLSETKNKKLDTESSITIVNDNINSFTNGLSESDVRGLNENNIGQYTSTKETLEVNLTSIKEELNELNSLLVDFEELEYTLINNLAVLYNDKEAYEGLIEYLQGEIDNLPPDTPSDDSLLLKLTQSLADANQALIDVNDNIESDEDYLLKVQADIVDTKQSISEKEVEKELIENNLIEVNSYISTLTEINQLIDEQLALGTSGNMLGILNQMLVEKSAELVELETEIIELESEIQTCQSELQTLLTQLETLESQLSELQILIKEIESLITQNQILEKLIYEGICYHVRIGDLKNEYNGTMVRINQDDDVVDFRAQDFVFYHNSNSETAGAGFFSFRNLVGNRYFEFPNKNGTIALLEDLTNTGLWEEGSGGTGSLVTVGANSNIASGPYALSEGYRTQASAFASHAEGRDTKAIGNYSHAEGYLTSAEGNYSHAEGAYTQAEGDYSHAEGRGTRASGDYSHAEGFETEASGTSSHAEGDSTIASGDYSHAEGDSTIASGDYSHAEGDSTIASGDYSHAEGFETEASGDYSHAEGRDTEASGTSSHAEGGVTTASGTSSHAEGGVTTAIGTYSHAEGYYTIASGTSSHAEGFETEAIGKNSHAEGNDTKASGENSHAEGSSYSFSSIFVQLEASGKNSHAEGQGTRAIGDESHAEGTLTVASGRTSHAEGQNTDAIGLASHAEGNNNNAIGDASHAEGSNNNAIGGSSHAEGSLTTSSGNYSHAEGNRSEASGDYSHAEGDSTIAGGQGSHAEGRDTEASGTSSHAEGQITVASGFASHAEGIDTIASGDYSHAEGANTIASGNYSHAAGYLTTASGENSHAEGRDTEASGTSSHAEGQITVASGEYSHAEGFDTIAFGDYSHVEGHGNTAHSHSERVVGSYSTNYTATSSTSFNESDRAFVVGIGDSDTNRKDGIIVNKDGTNILPSQTTLQYTNNVDGKIIVTKEVLEDKLSNIILKSPSGALWQLSVDDSGNLSTTVIG